MTGEATLKEVIGRLGKAIDTLEQAVGARLDHEQDYSEAEVEVQRMNADRGRSWPPNSTIRKRAPNGWKKPTRKSRAGW